MKTDLIVVDANVILSALLGGKARTIFTKEQFLFVTAKFTILEVLKYSDIVAKKSGRDQRSVIRAISLLPLIVLNFEDYKIKWKLRKV